MKNTEDLSYLYQRFLDNQSSREELQQLFEHFSTTDETQLRELISTELNRGQTEESIDPRRKIKLQQLYQNISNRINTDTQNRFNYARIWRISAAIAAMILICFAYWFFNKPVEIKTVYAAYGQHLEIQLPDSSKVWLNAGTTLQYPTKFAADRRSVILKDGEAYFEIKHDKQRSFSVSANGAEISVLGTSFEITAFKNEDVSKITVKTGKVGVMPFKIKTIFLLPGDRAVLNKATQQVQLTKIDTADIGAWRSHRLVFDNQPIAEVFRSLERTYNVHIEIKNEHLLKERITMRLNNQPLNNVLTAISFSNHFSYEKINDQLVIVK